MESGSGPPHHKNSTAIEILQRTVLVNAKIRQPLSRFLTRSANMELSGCKGDNAYANGILNDKLDRCGSLDSLIKGVS